MADADVQAYISRLSRDAAYTPEGYLRMYFTMRP